MKLLFFDIETSGLDIEKHAILELAGIIDVDRKQEEFQFFARPFSKNPPYNDHVQQYIDNKALEINGIKKEDLKDAKYWNPICVHRDFTNLLGKYVDKYDKQDKFFLIGKNSIKFDEPMLRRFFENCGDAYLNSWFWNPSIDMEVIIGYFLMHKRHELSDFKLITLAKHFGIEVNEDELHGALYDAKLTMKLYYKLIQLGEIHTLMKVKEIKK